MATTSISASTHSLPATSPSSSPSFSSTSPPHPPPHPPPLPSLPMSHFPLWRLPPPPSLLVDNPSFPLPFLRIPYFSSSSYSSKLIHKPSHSTITSSTSALSLSAIPHSPPPILPFSSSSSSSSNSIHEAFNTILLLHANLHTLLSFSTVAPSIFVPFSPTTSPSLFSTSSLSLSPSGYPPPASLLSRPFPPRWFPRLPFLPFSNPSFPLLSFLLTPSPPLIPSQGL